MATLKEFYKNKKEKDMNFFFGEGNFTKTSNQYFTFQRILNDDEIIVVTDNIKTIKGNKVLVVANNKVVYLKDWQVKGVENFFDGIYSYAVKLNRNYFKTYTFSFNFEDMAIEDEYTFDSLMDIAKEQQEKNLKFKLS